MKNIAFIGDEKYFDSLFNHEGKPDNLELKLFNTASDLFSEAESFNAESIILMINHCVSNHKRTDYFGLFETFPALRMFYQFKGKIILLGFEKYDKLPNDPDFINQSGNTDRYLQLPMEWSGLIKELDGEVKFTNNNRYITFLRKCGYLNSLKHKYANTNDAHIKSIIDFIEKNSTVLPPTLLKVKNNIFSMCKEKELPMVKLLIVDDSEYFSSCLKDSFHKLLPLYEGKLGVKIEIISTMYSISTGKSKGIFHYINSSEKEDNFDFVEAPGFLEGDGDIQAVLLDWQLEKPGHGGTETLYQPCIKNTLVKRIRNFRPDIHIYAMTAFSDSAIEITNMQENVKSFFFKEEMLQDPMSILDRILLKNYTEKRKAPFWEAYQDYVENAVDTWHPPGHCRGKGFFNSPYLRPFYDYWGRNVFTGDLSFGVNDIGFLDESDGAIGKAQKVAAKTFGASKGTFFITNGTSTSNKVVMQSILKPGDKVIIDKNCHKSNHYGFLLADANPIFLETIFLSEYSVYMPPTLDTIKKALSENRDAKMLLLTGSNYEGIVINTKMIVDLAKKIIPKIKVFIDEAWFAYSAFHPEMRKYSAIHCGADYVTQSAHKVLSSFSQASFIHVNDPDFESRKDFFRDVYQAYLSTSPQYQIISSLDICSMQMRMEGFKIIQNLISLSTLFCEQIKSWEPNNIKVIDADVLKLKYSDWEKSHLYKDPLKVLLDISDLNYSTEKVCKYLNREVGLELERRTKNTILVIFTIGTDRSMVFRLISALKNINDKNSDLPALSRQDRKEDGSTKTVKNTHSNNLILLSPRVAFYSSRKKVPLAEAQDAISASLVTPYPPGIPLLVFGQFIEKMHIDQLIEMKDDPNINNIHGVNIKNSIGYVSVVTIPKGLNNVDYKESDKIAYVEQKNIKTIKQDILNFNKQDGYILKIKKSPK